MTKTTLLALLCGGVFCATVKAEVPRTIRSAAVDRPPVIDGILAAGEWQPATLVAFEMPMAGLGQGQPTSRPSRTARFRAMHSANALYLAFEVADSEETADLAKGEFDIVNLTFCRGPSLAADDDRRVLIPGIYLDKHLVKPGQDADDTRKHGTGVMAYKDGMYAVELALPLDSGDAQDIQLKPGESVRFNLVFADTFRANLEGTEIGGLFSPSPDDASDWGRLILASNVSDDGGGAFRGPVWMAERLEASAACRGERLQIREAQALPQIHGSLGKVVIGFTYTDLKGKRQQAQAKVFLPAQLRAGGGEMPLLYSAGYELDDGSANAYQNLGMVVVTPLNMPTNPIARGPNLDVALLHLARSFAFVDNARVVVSGTSAGGYTALMLAAETFPLAGVIADVPPVNWGYNASYFYRNKDRVNKAAGTALEVPVLASVLPIAQQALTFYPADTEDPRWFRSSPVAHVDTISCPVSAFFSTGDVLVPIQQVSQRYVKAFDKRLFPPGFTVGQSELMASRNGRLTLLDALPVEDCVVIEMAVPAGMKRLPRRGEPAVSTPPVPLVPPFSDARQWSIVVLDEGPPEPQGGHFQHHFFLDQRTAIQRYRETPIARSQLTPRKLERLMARFQHEEWLPCGLHHLDSPEAEHVDVLRGLIAYVEASPQHAAQFLQLYATLPAARQALGATVIKANATAIANVLRQLR